MDHIEKKLDSTLKRFAELEGFLADQAVIADKGKYQEFAREYSELLPIVNTAKEYARCTGQLEEAQQIIVESKDKDLVALAQSELVELEQARGALHKKLEDLLFPKKEQEDRNLIIEIRAGTGGEEASLFAADLYRMYTKYADSKGWKVESMSSAPSETGGFKEVIFSVSGRGAAHHLQWESGAHRVQRVPSTEASGRIHTSAATVAVMLEPEEVDIKIEPKDLNIDVFRSSGPGGQSVNTTDSAVRITHLPTGTVVVCQDERSQLKNRAKAMRVLRARIMDKIQQEDFERTSKDRKSKIGSGDRSEKIRTYNFPDRRVTDHRIGLSLYKLDQIMNGDLQELFDGLIKADEDKRFSEEAPEK